MAVVEREREQSDQAGSGPARPPAPGDRAKRKSEERRAAAGRNALIGMVRARSPAKATEHVQSLARFVEAGEPSAEVAAAAEAGDRPSAPAGPAPHQSAAQPSPPPEAGEAPDPEGSDEHGAETADTVEARPVEPASAKIPTEQPTPDPGPEQKASPEVADPALAPALQAVAAARAAAVRVRKGARVHAAVRPFRADTDQPAFDPGVPLPEAVRRGGSFRPLRQVSGPLPFVTGDWRPRRPHLTVPPSAWVETPQRRRDLASDPETPERGERFQRFRAQVEKTAPSELDEEGATWTTNVPAKIGLPLESPPSVWQRFLRLFKGANRPNAG